MKISIITACYNNSKTLQQTIDSLRNQSYEDKEHIIIDGGSTDGSLDILEANKAHITYISEPDKGIYDALNKGLKLVTGYVVGTLGADDFYPHREVLERIAHAFTRNPTDALYGDKQYIGQADENKVVRFWKAGKYAHENWYKGWMPPHLAFYLKRSCFLEHGNYRTDFTCSGDYELMLRMLFVHKVSVQYLPELIVTMRTGGTSTASFKHRMKANQEDRRAWKVNGLKPRWYTLWLKPIFKISQFWVR